MGVAERCNASGTICWQVSGLTGTNARVANPRSRQPRIQRRYSIGEWYGKDFFMVSPGERRAWAERELEVAGLTGIPCPFQRNANCNKKGGVCSLRMFEKIGEGPVQPRGPLITTCPNRFLERDEIFHWVSETILGTAMPLVLSEVGFLDRLVPSSDETADEEGEGDFIGRIDNVLVHPDRVPIQWCALEIQAVYFSGRSMRQEFVMLSRHEGEDFPFPTAHRRPDWRSSGPKRLLPQLQTKIPTIRTWGKKMAVVIDRGFFESLVGLERERYLSNAEIVWFVVDYGSEYQTWSLQRGDVAYTKLDASVKALTGGTPLSKERFEEELIKKIRSIYPSHDFSTRE